MQERISIEIRVVKYRSVHNIKKGRICCTVDGNVTYAYILAADDAERLSLSLSLLSSRVVS